MSPAGFISVYALRDEEVTSGRAVGPGLRSGRCPCPSRRRATRCGGAGRGGSGTDPNGLVCRRWRLHECLGRLWWNMVAEPPFTSIRELQRRKKQIGKWGLCDHNSPTPSAASPLWARVAGDRVRVSLTKRKGGPEGPPANQESLMVYGFGFGFGVILPGAGRSTLGTTSSPSLFQSRIPQNLPAL